LIDEPEELESGMGFLMHLLDGAVRSGRPTLLVVDGRGTVSVYPSQHCYVTDVQDWDSVYTASREQIQVRPSTWCGPPGDAQPLEELQWRLAYHDAHWEEGLAAHVLLHLKSWPNLTRLPEELIEPVTRICALLWRKPTVGYLVARVLDLPPEQAGHLLHVLQAFGHVSRPSIAATVAAADAGGAPEAEMAVPPAVSTFASRFLQRLLRTQAA
jgi:hypothetical protein